MLFLFVFHSVSNIARSNNCLWMENEHGDLPTSAIAKKAFFLPLQHINSCNQEYIGDCSSENIDNISQLKPYSGEKNSQTAIPK